MDNFINTAPKKETIKINGETITVAPLTIGELPAVMTVLKSVTGLSLENVDVIALMADHGDAIIEIVSLVVKKERSWVATLMPDEFAMLFSAVLSVNADFFIQRVVPLIKEMTVAVEKRTAAIPGQTTSPLSSPPAPLTKQ